MCWRHQTLAAPRQVSDLAALVESGKYAEAERAARTRLKEVEARHPANSTDVADVLDVLVEALMRQGQGTPEAKAFAERAVAIRAAAGAETAAHARSVNLLANVIELQGDIKTARDLYERAADIAVRALGPSDSLAAMMRKDVAIAYRGLGDYQKAKTILQQTLADRAKVAPDHVDIGKLQHNLGAVLWELGEFEAARDAFAAAAERLRAALGGDHPHVASALEGLAVVHVALGDYSAARAGYESALAIREKTLGPDHPDIGNSLANLGDVLAVLGDNVAARAALERGIKVWERGLPPDHPLLTVGLTNLGVVLGRLGDRAAGRRALQRAIAIREKTIGSDHAELVVPLIQLANMTADDGDIAAAQGLYARARKLAESARGATHPFVAAAAYEEGVRLAKAGHIADARPLLERAHAIRAESLGADHPSTAESVDSLARLAASTGAPGKALTLALQAESVAREHFRATAAALPERQALLFSEQRTRSQDLALALAIKSDAPGPTELESLWDAVVRSRALVLDEMAWRQRIAVSGTDDALRTLLHQLADARATLSRLFLDPAPEKGYRDRLAAAREKKERLEEALAARSAVYREQTEQRAFGLKAVRERLPERTAVVAYVRFASAVYAKPPGKPAHEYAAFVLDGGKNLSLVPLGRADRIDRAIDAWRRRIREESSLPTRGSVRSERLYRETAGPLRAAIWDPVARLVAGASQVFVVPDGALHLVDFGALPTGATSYLAERGPILHYLSTERDVFQRSGPAGAGLLAVGAPAYAGGAAARLRESASAACGRGIGAFAPLPETGREVESVGRLWREHGDAAVLLRGADASEARVKALAPGKRILHFATHGFFLDEPCSAAARGLADSPLLRAGLAFAGANTAVNSDARDDGILTGEEITGLDLRGVEWTVLSACDSGLGEVRSGEGVLGLRRALLVAGTRTIITSLWQVDDVVARRWMEHAYRERLQQTRSTAAAVHAAGIGLLKARRQAGLSAHPFYWAGFVAVGDWR